MSAAAKPRRATYDDLRELGENKVGEILDGELFASPRPAVPHAIAGSVLGQELTGPFQKGRGGPGGWWLLYELELHLAEDVIVPDWAGWRRERVSPIPPGPFITISPDWVCEILSPSTERMDRVRKLPVYAREGVKHAWLVNPLQRTLEVFRSDGGRWILLTTHEGDAIVRAEPFDAIELELSLLWAGAPPPEGISR